MVNLKPVFILLIFMYPHLSAFISAYTIQMCMYAVYTVTVYTSGPLTYQYQSPSLYLQLDNLPLWFHRIQVIFIQYDLIVEQISSILLIFFHSFFLFFSKASTECVTLLRYFIIFVLNPRMLKVRTLLTITSASGTVTW